MSNFLSMRQLALGLGMLLMPHLGCAPDLDTRPLRPTQVGHDDSAGAIIYEELCSRVSHSADPKDHNGSRSRALCHSGAAPTPGTPASVVALHAQRPQLIRALNTVFTPDLVDDSKTLLRELLPLYDDGIMRTQAVAMADLASSVATSPLAVQALARQDARAGYAPAGADLGLLRHALLYGGIDDAVGGLLGVIGTGAPGAGVWRQVQETMQAQLTHDPAAALVTNPARYTVWRDYLLSSSPAASPADTAPAYVVRRDMRGMAMAAQAGGALVAPFVDTNGDGLADVDAQGRFVDAQGAVLAVPAPFGRSGGHGGVRRDEFGRPVSADGALLYAYVDTAHTVLAGVLEQGRQLFTAHPEAALQWAPAARALLGRDTPQTHTYSDGAQIRFTGYNPDAAPALDVVHATAFAMGREFMPQTLEFSERMWNEHEAPVAEAIDLGWKIHGWLQEPALKAAHLEENSNVFDDLLEVATDIAREPGLLKDVLVAARDPKSLELGARFAEQMRYRDRIDFNPADINAVPTGGFHTPVDRTWPDDEVNRSVLQRLLHLVHDTSGRVICNKKYFEFEPCQLFKIDDAALFYLRAITGQAELRLNFGTNEVMAEQFTQPTDEGLSAMEGYTGILGFKLVDGSKEQLYATFSVTPQAAARMLFTAWDPRIPEASPAGEAAQRMRVLFDDLKIDNVSMTDLHRGTLFAWELNGFFDAMQPVLNAFAAHHREDLVVKLLSTLHMHWGSPQGFTTRNDDATTQLYANKSAIVRFEDLLARTLTEGRALEILEKLGRAAESISVSSSMDRWYPASVPRNGEDVLVDLIQQMLLPERNLNIHFRNGKVTTVKNDRKTVVRHIALVHLFKSALTDMGDLLDALLPDDSQARNFVESVAHVALDVRQENGAWRFANRSAQALTSSAIGFARQRLAAHMRADDVAKWAATFVPDAQDVLTNPVVASTTQLLGQLGDNAAAQASVGAFAKYLVDTSLPALRVAATDALQLAADVDDFKPLLAALAPAFTPDTGAAAQLLRVLEETRRHDSHKVVPKLTNNLANEVPIDGEAPRSALQIFGDAYAAVNRVQPGVPGPLGDADYKAMMTTLHDFLLDRQNGFERLCKVVETRNNTK